MSQKIALITGILGQDGSYLAGFLLNKNYEVHGLIPQRTLLNYNNINHIRNKLILHTGDMLDYTSIFRILNNHNFNEVYNLAAQSFPHKCWEQPEHTLAVNASAVAVILGIIKGLNEQDVHQIKFYQASTSHQFGRLTESPQNEKTPFRPNDPYGVSKTVAHQLTNIYREKYGLFACCGILYNHTSPRRPKHFVVSKIAHAVRNIKYENSKQTQLALGNLDTSINIGHAKDYVEAMWLMMQQKEPDNYIVCEKFNVTLRDIVSSCFGYFDMDYSKYVTVNKEFWKPIDKNQPLLTGNSDKIRSLGWWPQYSLTELLIDMLKG